MGREGETPAQIFWHIGIKKKWYKLSKLGGEGVEVIWTKSKRTATYFRKTFPKSGSQSMVNWFAIAKDVLLFVFLENNALWKIAF